LELSDIFLIIDKQDAHAELVENSRVKLIDSALLILIGLSYGLYKIRLSGIIIKVVSLLEAFTERSV